MRPIPNNKSRRRAAEFVQAARSLVVITLIAGPSSLINDEPRIMETKKLLACDGSISALTLDMRF